MFLRRMFTILDTEEVEKMLVLGNQIEGNKSNHKANTNHKAIKKKNHKAKIKFLALVHSFFTFLKKVGGSELGGLIYITHFGPRAHLQ